MVNSFEILEVNQVYGRLGAKVKFVYSASAEETVNLAFAPNINEDNMVDELRRLYPEFKTKWLSRLSESKASSLKGVKVSDIYE